MRLATRLRLALGVLPGAGSSLLRGTLGSTHPLLHLRKLCLALGQEAVALGAQRGQLRLGSCTLALQVGAEQRGFGLVLLARSLRLRGAGTLQGAGYTLRIAAAGTPRLFQRMLMQLA